MLQEAQREGSTDQIIHMIRGGGTTKFEHLPNEILLEILEYVGGKSFLKWYKEFNDNRRI